MRGDNILKGVLLALLVTATFNLSWQVYSEAQAADARRRLYEEHGIIACKLGLTQDESSRLLIELGMALAFTGCRIKRAPGILVSLSGLLFAAGVYGLWWRYYFMLVEVSGASEGAVDHLFFLYGGRWLDLCIAASLPILVAWQASAVALLPAARRE